jgi:hypothetical protein
MMFRNAVATKCLCITNITQFTLIKEYSTIMTDDTLNTETLCAKCRGFNARQEMQTVTTLPNGVYRTANR